MPFLPASRSSRHSIVSDPQTPIITSSRRPSGWPRVAAALLLRPFRPVSWAIPGRLRITCSRPFPCEHHIPTIPKAPEAPFCDGLGAVQPRPVGLPGFPAEATTGAVAIAWKGNACRIGCWDQWRASVTSDSTSAARPGSRWASRFSRG